jgi:hypothetical protein
VNTKVVQALNYIGGLRGYIRYTTPLRFIYCQKSVDKESFHFFFFWALPFDVWTWALLALSLVALTLVSKGEWLNVFAALFVRQSYSSLDKNKCIILLLFAAIVITCGYESIISSHLIVPPPIIVARNLKDLVDAGYGISGFGTGTDNRMILSILRRENVSHSSVNEPPFILTTYKSSNPDAWELLSRSNRTSPVNSVEIEVYQDQVDLLYPRSGIKCHFVKDTQYPFKAMFTYSGYTLTTVHTFVNSFQESGILDMLYQFWDYAKQLEVRVRLSKRKYVEEKTEFPLELRDPKIISIFIAWSVLLMAACLSFLVESLLGLSFNFYVICITIKLIGK